MEPLILERVTRVPAPLDRVFDFFSRAENLARITPPSMGFEILDAPARALRQNDRITYRIRIGGIPLRWVTRIASWNPPDSFTDEQLSGPYRLWVHTHSFRQVGSTVEMRDHVEYMLPLRWVGRIVAGRLVRRKLRAIFDHRQRRIARIFGE